MLPRAFDLHVLGLPPAFALSQDQTLKLDENFSRPITTFDEVPLLYVARTSVHAIARAPTCRFHDNSVDLKRRPPKSLPGRAPMEKAEAFSEDCGPAGTPPSTFLFLPIHLSNSPEPRGGPLPGSPGEPSKHQTADF